MQFQIDLIHPLCQGTWGVLLFWFWQVRKLQGVFNWLMWLVELHLHKNRTLNLLTFTFGFLLCWIHYFIVGGCDAKNNNYGQYIIEFCYVFFFFQIKISKINVYMICLFWMFLQIVKLCMFLQVLLIKIQRNMIFKHWRILKKPIKKTQERLKKLKGLETCEAFLVLASYRCWRL